MLECINLIKEYDGRIVVNNLSFKVGKGEVFALLGSNGAGKTTSIKMILGLIDPTKGKILKNENIKIGYSPETPYFQPFLTAKGIMEFFYKLQKLDRRNMDREIDKILEKVGLIDYKNNKGIMFSKGMKQRLAIAQSLIGKPDFIILDEPTAGLDALGRIEILDLIRSLKKEGKTIILNSHILDDVQKVADRGIIMKKGETVTKWDKNNWSNDESLEELFIKSVGGGM